MVPTDRERRRAWVELGLVAGTAALQLLFSGLFGLAGSFAVVASVGWIVYLSYRLRESGRARAWGLRRDTLRAASIANATFIVVGGIAMVAYGWSRGHSAPLGKVAWLVVAYSVWGLIQQLMICALVFGNLSIILGSHVRAQIVTVLLFASVHLPDVRLCLLTGVAATVWTTFFARWPNLFAQAVSHGTLATLAYFYVLGRDPWR